MSTRAGYCLLMTTPTKIRPWCCLIWSAGPSPPRGLQVFGYRKSAYYKAVRKALVTADSLIRAARHLRLNPIDLLSIRLIQHETVTETWHRRARCRNCTSGPTRVNRRAHEAEEPLATMMSALIASRWLPSSTAFGFRRYTWHSRWEADASLDMRCKAAPCCSCRPGHRQPWTFRCTTSSGAGMSKTSLATSA